MHEFAEFVDAKPVAPLESTDAMVLGMVEKDLRPTLWGIFSKVTLVEVAAGLVTLTICPQFGVGFGHHNQLLHTLHLATHPALYYIICGLIFVITGGALSGLVLSRNEIRSAATARYPYFAAYAVLVYVVLISFGAEVFVVSSLTWMLGALLGNVLGFEAMIRLRHAAT
jgi:hypothetical protein